jgi:flagellar biosynthesis/type III secretory pathway protein FliH
MNENDAIEQAYRNGYEQGRAAGRRCGVCEFAAFLIAVADNEDKITTADIATLREKYTAILEQSKEDKR